MPFLLTLPPVVLASLIGGGATVGTSLLAGRERKGAGRARAEASRQSFAETRAIEQRSALMDRLTKMASSGGRPPTFQFGEAAGGPANDAGFYEQIRPMAGINLLMQLAGMGTPGTGATAGFLNRDLVESGQRQASAGELGSNITFLIAELLKNQGITGRAEESGGGPSFPAPPLPPRGSGLTRGIDPLTPGGDRRG